MITDKQLVKLRKYAEQRSMGLERNIRVSLASNLQRSVEIRYGEDLHIALGNRPASCLTMKRVKHHIDKCAERHAEDKHPNEAF